MSLPTPIRPVLSVARVVALASVLAILPALAPAPLAAQVSRSLEQAQALVDQGRAQAALPLLDSLLAKEPGNARGLLLRSTARFLTDDLEGGRRDLDRALELDPDLRQGWLNRAGLDIAGKRYDSALASLARAEQLDPAAADNDLNIGAVLLLQGKLEPASTRFQSYLGKQEGKADEGRADALYLVATNYALAGYASLAIEHLRRAVALEERSRLRARTDPNFASLGGNPRFRELLATDAWKPPAGALLATRTYQVPYGEDGELLGAVLDALRETGERHDARVESAPAWALVWGNLRVKVSRTADGRGLVEVSASPGLASEAEWRQRTDRLFQQIAAELLAGQRAKVKRRPEDPSRQ